MTTHRSLCLLFGLIVYLPGCDSKDPSRPSAIAPTASDEASLSPSDVASGPSSDSIPTDSKSVVPDVAAPTSSLISGSPPNNAAAVTEGKPAQSESEPSLKSKRIFVPPSAEQQTRWTTKSYEPLQLVGLRESERIGLVTNIAGTADGRHYILAGNKVTLWAIDKIEPEHVFVDYSREEQQFSKYIAVAPNGKWLASADNKGNLTLWNLETRQQLANKQVERAGIADMVIDPDSKELATVGYDGQVSIWDATNLEPRKRFKVDTSGVKQIEYISSNLLAIAGETTSSWNTSNGSLEKLLSPGRYNTSLRRSNDGKGFTFGSKDGLHLWDMQASQTKLKLLGNFSITESVQFSEDSQFLATASGSSIRIWDLATQQVVQVLDHTGSVLSSIVWLPKSSLLLSASSNGRVRIWCQGSGYKALGLSPVMPANDNATSSTKEPATSAQALKIIDLRTFPKMPNATPRIDNETNCSYVTSALVAEAEQFCRYQFDRAGWSELTNETTSPGMLEFQKTGYTASASIVATGPTETSVTLNHLGNFDARTLPKILVDKKDVIFENAMTSMYKSSQPLFKIEAELIKKMNEQGWTPFSRLNAARNEQKDVRDLEFLKNGTIVRVYIGKFANDPTNYSIQYSHSLSLHAIAVPGDAGFMEFDGALKPNLVANTKMTIEESIAFYDRKMESEGWITSEVGRSIKPEYAWLVYIQGEQDVSIGLSKLENNRTLVRVGEKLESSSWQLGKLKPPVKDAVGTDVNALSNKPGLEAADFPVLDEAVAVAYQAEQQTIAYELDKISSSKVVENYIPLFQKLGWTKTNAGVMSDEYAMGIFQTKGAEVTVRVSQLAGKTKVNIQGDGLLWTKALPGKPKVLSYESWLRQNHPLGSLQWLDTYQEAMNAIDP